MATAEAIYRKTAGDEPLPGYRLIAPLGRGGYGEVWKCLAPGGLLKAVKFVAEHNENQHEPLRQEYEAFLRIKAIRHPFLLMLERVELLGGELIMVMELADHSLAHRYESCRAEGKPGIPRSELLSYMVDAAEALDVLSRQHKLQHLDVKPANLFLVGGHVKVGDYGLVGRVQTHSGSDGKLQRGLTPLYVPPEILQNNVDVRSDQYSLALVYQELLTGQYPYAGNTAQQLLYQHLYGMPNLNSLSAPERVVMAKALAKKPQERYSSCLEFVKALLQADTLLTTQPSVTLSSPTPPSILHPTPKELSPPLAPSGAAPASPTPPVIHANLSNATTGSSSVAKTLTLRNTPSNSISSTVSLRHANLHDEFSRYFPDYKILQELENGPRGRILRTTRGDQKTFCVHFVRATQEAKLDDLLQLGQVIIPGLIQKITVVPTLGVSFCYPEDWQTLQTVEQQRRATGRSWGRLDLLDRLKPVAELLDALHAQYGFAHGLLSPQQILCQAHKTGLTGYGIGEMLRRTNPDLHWINTEVYAAPEALRGQPHRASDQYSLAILYLELLSGQKFSKEPRRRQESIQSLLPHLKTHEGQAIRRALAREPHERYPTCQGLIQALSQMELSQSALTILDDIHVIESIARLNNQTDDRAPPDVFSLLNTWLAECPRPNVGPVADQAIRQPDQRWAFRFPVQLTPELFNIKLEAFCEEKRVQPLVVNPSTKLLRFKAREGKPAMELTVVTPLESNWAACEVLVYGRLIGSLESTQKAVPPAMVEIFEAFRRSMQPKDDRRRRPRFKVDWSGVVYPIDDELQVAVPITVKLRDISSGGASFVPTQPIHSGHLFLNLPGQPGSEWAILCKVVRTAPFIAVQYIGV